ncbi:MAG: hypothetical protein ACRED9_00880 [Caulobacteraceae bacterium]
MMDLAEHISVVKNQLEFHERSAVKFENQRHRAVMHLATAEGLRNLLGDLIWLSDFQTAHPHWMERKSHPQRLSLTWEEIDGLPPEVLSELSVSDSDRLEFSLVSAIQALGGVTSLDKLIVHLFNETKEIHKRTPLNQRLYRMTQKGMIHSVPGRKGAYSVEPLSDAESAELV